MERKRGNARQREHLRVEQETVLWLGFQYLMELAETCLNWVTSPSTFITVSKTRVSGTPIFFSQLDLNFSSSPQHRDTRSIGWWMKKHNMTNFETNTSATRNDIETSAVGGFFPPQISQFVPPPPPPPHDQPPSASKKRSLPGNPGFTLSLLII